MVDFLWDGGSSQIAYDVIIQVGWFKLIDFGEKIKIIWANRWTDGIWQIWKTAPALFYNTNRFSNNVWYNQTPVINISQFYQDVQKYVSHVQTVETTVVYMYYISMY